jgi:hypothetical protein
MHIFINIWSLKLLSLDVLMPLKSVLNSNRLLWLQKLRKYVSSRSTASSEIAGHSKSDYINTDKFTFPARIYSLTEIY